MASHPIQRFTPEEYLEFERQAEYKSEYLDGQIYAMQEQGQNILYLVQRTPLLLSIYL